MTSESLNTFGEIFLELLKPSTSPKNALAALQLMSTSFSLPDAYDDDEKEPALIFLAYTKFIMNKQPGGRVEEIYEEIVKKAFVYLRRKFLSYNLYELFYAQYPPNISTWLGPALRDQLIAWTLKVLSKHNNCPNPYVRLEIFRLYLFLMDAIPEKWRNRERVCLKTFIYTICEINPHYFYPSVNEYDPLFDACELRVIMDRMYKFDTFYNISDLNFLSNVIQLTGVFASRISKGTYHYDYIYSCTNVLKNLYNMSKQLTNQPTRKYLKETVCEMTATTIFNKGEYTEDTDQGIAFRNELVEELNLSPKLYDLPKLLLLRQIHGPKQVRKYRLLLPNLEPLFRTDDDSEYISDEMVLT